MRKRQPSGKVAVVICEFSFRSELPRAAGFLARFSRWENMDAEEFWNWSGEYVREAAEHLSPGQIRADHTEGPHDREEWLRLSFLFPTLPEKSRHDLLVVRRFFMIAREHQELERDDPDDSAEYSEAMADQVSQQLREALRTFSPMQQEILRAHYLILP